MSTNDAEKNGPPSTPNPVPEPAATATTNQDQSKQAALDQAAVLLRSAARKKRPWSFGALLLTLLFLGAPIAAVVWWLWRPSATVLLDVIAFDQVTLPGRPVTLRAELVPLDAESGTPSFTGHELGFVEIPPARLSPSPLVATKVRVSAHGVAICSWSPSARESMTEVAVSFDDPERSHSANSRARIFAWPSDTRVVLVEVEALAEAIPSEWKQEDLVDLPVSPGSASALQSARARKYQIVYVATGPATADAYRNIRDFWLDRRADDSEQAPLPLGPVLARSSYQADVSAAKAQEEIIAQLRTFYRGPFLAVARHAESAAVFRQAGLTTIQIGAAGKSWDDVAKALMD